MSNEDDYISEELAGSIRAGLAEENLASYSPEEAVHILSERWAGREVRNLLFAREYEWATMFTDEFDKQSGRYDRNLQGRILEAIKEIAKDPLSVKGDSQKPL